MTDIAESTRRNAYTATAGQTVFAYGWRVNASAGLRVYKNGVLLPSGQYSVSGVGNGAGGNVTLGSAAAEGDAIVIEGATPLARSTRYQDGQDMPAASFEADMTNLTMMVQEAKRDASLGLKLPGGDPLAPGDFVLPSLPNRAGKVLQFDEDGKPAALWKYDDFTDIRDDAFDAAASASGSASLAGASAAAAAAQAAVAAAQVVAASQEVAKASEQATAAAGAASRSASYAQAAKQAAEASASVYFKEYETAAAMAADAASIPADASVMVYNDETRGGSRTIYKKKSGTLEFMTVAGLDVDDLILPSFSGALARTVRSKFEEVVSIKDFGARGDGSGAQLSSAFGSLAEAQAVYPHAAALTDTIDWCGFQAALNYVRDAGRGQVFVPAGHYKTHTVLFVPDYCEIYGAGNASRVENINAGSDNRFKAVFDLGFLHPSHYGTRETGSGDPFTRLLDRYEAGAVTPLNRSVTLSTPGDAANFIVGELALVVDAAVNVQASTGVDIEIPLNASVLEVVSVNAGTGVVTFDSGIGFSASNSYAVRIPSGAQETGFPIRIAREVVVRDMRTDGRSTTCLAAAAYKSVIRNITGKVAWVVQGNAFARCLIENISQEFTVGALEIKWAAHDTKVDLLSAVSPIAAASSLGLMNIGEYCRNITVDRFSVSAPLVTGRASIQMQPGTSCEFRNGFVEVPSSISVPVVFYSDNYRSVDQTGIANCVFRTGARSSVSFAGNLTHHPSGCYVRGSTFLSNHPDAEMSGVAVAFDGGQGCEVSRCYFEKGYSVRFQSAAAGSILKDNVFQHASSFVGSGIAANAEGVSGNRKLSGGTFGAFGFDGVSPDRGNADYTIVANSPAVNIWKSALSSARTVNFNTANMVAGRRFRIVRAASATGGSNLNLSGLSRPLAAGEWAEVMFDGSAMVLIAAGSL